MKQFGEQIKTWREAAGLSQAELAAGVRCHPSHISRLERGFVAGVELGFALRLATTLGIGEIEILAAYNSATAQKAA